MTNIWGIEGNLKTKFSSEHVYMWITLWISCEFHIIFWKNLEELEEKEYTIYKRQSKNVQKWEFKNVQFYSLNISFKR